MKQTVSKIQYVKPSVLASTNNGRVYASYCNSKNKSMPIICRCDGK